MSFNNDKCYDGNIKIYHEYAIYSIVYYIFIVDVCLFWNSGIEIDYDNYYYAVTIGFILVLLGLWYRRYRSEYRLSSPLIAGGSFVLFTLVTSALNYLLLPTGTLAFDRTLVMYDSYAGYNWIDYVKWYFQRDYLVLLLAIVYASTQLQLISIVVLLGFRNEPNLLGRFILTVIAAALVSILIWRIFPTYGSAAYYDLPANYFSPIQIIVDPEYGKELRELAANGIAKLTPINALGIIGFPSFHIVMSLIAVAFTRHIAIAAPIYQMITLAIFPATLLHGGHHLCDLVGGIVVFFVAYFGIKSAGRYMR